MKWFFRSHCFCPHYATDPGDFGTYRKPSTCRSAYGDMDDGPFHNLLNQTNVSDIAALSLQLSKPTQIGLKMFSMSVTSMK